MNKPRQIIQERPVVSFILLSISISWPLWRFQLMIPQIFGRSDIGPYLDIVFGFVPYFGPLIAAAALTRLTGGDLQSWASQIWRWRVAPHWYGFALLLPLLCSVGVTVVSAVFINAPWTISFLDRPTNGQYIFSFVTLLINAIGIEAGLRGFALPWLLQRFNALIASVILGVIWAIWTLPQLLFPGSTISMFAIFMYVPALVVFSVLLTYVYNSTNGSVLVVALLSASIQNVVGYSALEAPSLAMQLIILAVWAIPALTITHLYGDERLAERLPPTENIANTLDG